jgi:hypothetical protein
MRTEVTFKSVWLWSFAFFIIAAITGFLYRYGMFYTLPAELSLNNIRHAHSHLMFFNWVTPVPMLFIAAYICSSIPAAVPEFKKAIYSVLIIGFASFPFFLFYGYRSVPVAGAELPFSVILSGLIMIAWYWFIRIYLKYRTQSKSGLPRIFYDASLLMLFVSSLGAWGVAVFQFGNIDHPLLSAAMTHFFLAVFTGGWCVLSAFGIIYHIMEVIQPDLSESWLVAPIVLGVPLTFPFGLPVELLTSQLLITASFGAILVSIGLLANIYLLLKLKRIRIIWWWMVTVNLLIAHALMLFGGGVFPFLLWIGEHGLRVLYLHVILLGFVSMTYLGAWHSLHRKMNRNGLKFFTFSILILLIMLFFSSGLIPASWLPAWHFQALLWVSGFPVIAAIFEFVIHYKTDSGSYSGRGDLQSDRKIVDFKE